MNRPDPTDITEILERCLTRLQAGQDIETVLLAFPDHSEALRPILESVQAVWAARGSDTVPVAAMTRSRNKLMKAVYDMKQAAPLPWWRRPPVFLRGAVVPLAVSLVCFSLVFTGIASAQSLPGQALYSVKLAAEHIVLSLPASPSAQLAREQGYDLRRKDEVETLISQNQEQEVEMTGFLMKTADGTAWLLDKSPLVIPAALQDTMPGLEGRFVAIHADLMPNGQLNVKTIEPRVYLISGKIQQLEDNRLQVGDIWFGIGSDSQVGSALDVGAQVEISVTRLPNGEYFAIRVIPVGVAQAVEPTKPQRKNTATEGSPESTATDVEIQPTDTAESTKKATEVNPTEKDPTKVEPTDVPYSSSTPVERRTPMASRTPRPRETGKPDPTKPPEDNHSPEATATAGHATRTPEHSDDGSPYNTRTPTPTPTQKSDN